MSKRRFFYYKHYLIAGCISFCKIYGDLSEDIYLKRINAHFLVQDYQTACLEAVEARSLLPQSKSLSEAHIQALARAGEERLCLAAWKDYCQLYPADEVKYPLLIEEMAWCTIHKAASSHAPPLRLLGVLAAFLSQDAKGINLVTRGLSDPNTLIRAATVKLCGSLHDAVLQDGVVRLLSEEKAWKVRLEAIKTAGSMKLTRTRPALLAIASDPTAHAAERAAATSALVQMQKKISRPELIKLVNSDRAGMRVLACEIVAHLQLNDSADLLIPLLNDYSAEVRAEVLYTIGVLRLPIDLQKGRAVQLLDDSDPSVAITAAWVVSPQDQERGHKAFKKLIEQEEPDVRRLAASALVATGKYGFPLIEDAFFTTKDPYVRLNLALGLIGQRQKTKEASDAIFETLMSQPEQIMENDTGRFTYIAPTTIKHDELTPNYPEAVNQKTRLELLNILAVLKHTGAHDAIKLFLQQKKWGISGLASAVLLTEGDDAALDLVKQLLNDPEPALRLQAALVLALWGGEEDALTVLESAYPDASFEEKEKILEGIGRVGSKKSLNFLIDRLQESHQSLRLIAAAGLLQILYN